MLRGEYITTRRKVTSLFIYVRIVMPVLSDEASQLGIAAQANAPA